MNEMGEVDITSADFKADPFPFYKRLRATAPVFSVSIKPLKCRAWLITRYDHVAALLKDERFLKDARAAGHQEPFLMRLVEPLRRSLLGVDGPEHRRLRTLVSKAFTPATVKALKTDAHFLVRKLINRIPPGRTVDAVTAIAQPLPVTLIARLLGLAENDHDKFISWTKRFTSAGSGVSPIKTIPAILKLMNYLRQQIASRRNCPDQGLISHLISAQETDQRLSDQEILAMVFLLLSAGHETTTNLLSAGLLTLLQNPEQASWMRLEPSRVPSAVEELLRFISPAETATERYAREDLSFQGVRISRGDLVLGVLASANRDETVFSNPDDLILDRQPNPHLALGSGAHFCLGAALTRMETTVCLEQVFANFPLIRQDPGGRRPVWRSGLILRGVLNLPLIFE